MTDFEARVLGDLSALKCQMDQLLGIGQPGRLHELEARVDRHEQGLERLKGVLAAGSVAMTLAHLVITYVGGRHH